MESGYNILWTDRALYELAATFDYLEINFTERELKKLSAEIDKILNLISKNPDIFPTSDRRGIRRVVIKKFNTLYYRKRLNSIEILSFFSNRQDPSIRKL